MRSAGCFKWGKHQIGYNIIPKPSDKIVELHVQIDDQAWILLTHLPISATPETARTAILQHMQQLNDLNLLESWRLKCNTAFIEMDIIVSRHAGNIQFEPYRQLLLDFAAANRKYND